MARLADHPQYMEFAGPLRIWEGCALHFYGDSRGLVTLGIGHLFDNGDLPLSPQMDLNYGRALADTAGNRYAFLPNSSPAAIYADWLRVKRHVLALLPAHPWKDAYAPVAQLRITTHGAEAGVKSKVQLLSNPIYNAHPILEQFDVRLAMAIVDVRFNPAHVSVAGARFEPIWQGLEAAFNAASGSAARTAAAQSAYDHFRQLYAHHQNLTARFIRRQRHRTLRFRLGVEATLGVAINGAPADESEEVG